MDQVDPTFLLKNSLAVFFFFLGDVHLVYFSGEEVDVFACLLLCKLPKAADRRTASDAFFTQMLTLLVVTSALLVETSALLV